MENLFEQFEISCIKTQELLEKGIHLIKQGFAPDASLCQSISSSLISLRSVYDEIRQEMPAHMLEEELPVDDLPVSKYEELWRNSILGRKKAVHDVLAEFIRVYSDEQRYMEAIIPHIDTARGLLEDISAEKDASQSIDVSAYRLFLAGVNADLSNDEELYDQLLDCSVFNARIVKGLSEDKYHIHEEIVDDLLITEHPEDNGEKETEVAVTKEASHHCGINDSGLSRYTPFRFSVI